MPYKEVERSLRPLVQFVLNSPVEAKVAGPIRSITTVNGSSEVVDLDVVSDAKFTDLLNGQKVEATYGAGTEVCVFKTAGLAVDDSMIGQRLRITYLGIQNNPRNNREYHGYKVEVWQD